MTPAKERKLKMGRRVAGCFILNVASFATFRACPDRSRRGGDLESQLHDAWRAIEDEPTRKATYPLKLPLSIKKGQRLAKRDGVSLNQWMAAAVAEKVGVVETAAEFFKRQAGEGHGRGDDEVFADCAADDTGAGG